MSDHVEIEKILKIIETSSYDTVEELIEQVNRKSDIPKSVILKIILELRDEGKIKLISPAESMPSSPMRYLISVNAAWFWVILFFSIVATISVSMINETDYPFVYLRYILGSPFILFTPGYSLLKTLFPKKEIYVIERIFMSLVTSVSLIPLIGLILNYSPWGLRLIPMTASLFSITTALSVVGLIRGFRARRMTFYENSGSR